MYQEKLLTLLFKFRWQIAFLLVGVSLIGLGIVFTKNSGGVLSDKVEVLESATEGQNKNDEIVVEVSGAVENPGVYKLSDNSRIEDALIAAGGVSADADRDWMEKVINRAAKITDGQKIYIAAVGEQTGALSASIGGGNQSGSSTNLASSSKLVNVNTASQNQLESLWGIGPVTAQNIIEQRPYSSVQELLDKKILKSNVYERNKDILTVY
ncbi:hypothetical protein A2630_04590 [Candidatus Woesebacteria bacterium RIFCSPHIGHO2_01_FULL_44_10]|uniref:Soluble ligand binding domain-containing protein n=1 Tax=Candidatus Woesebacteria bacterium RIFCSPLOWO2_01_FULL_44_14 TaxID=1802525 RepID=A0A1F8C4K6_9BACT|nr:MAG: hypothetical protein A2630_04590 [Candidatus Woesebacteria bacterium RIFCSPHIGHO2_01_FULL_44_10]OGM54572.1 MAG: hypothetical protein A3F62_03045 [Candidatus Woesebacteria bacterium RIFCSPHIGHO2_12_FULL_44_11]OGM70595.1 MAG: hypothetical protein A2975_00070 [Candidatus Woesebacteria bacterium RIFCSPLOWO2_01_FULL_44_14]